VAFGSLLGCRSVEPARTEEGQSPSSQAGQAFIDFYQVALGPQWAFHCDFEPSCSAFGREAIGWHGLVAGSWITADRLMRDHPFSRNLYPRTQDGAPKDPVHENAFWFASFVDESDEPEEDAAPHAVPTNAETLFAFAETFFGDREFERARVEYLRYLFLHPTGARVQTCYRRIAICLARLGRHRDAHSLVQFVQPVEDEGLLRALLAQIAGEPHEARKLADSAADAARVEATRIEANLVGGFYALEAGDSASARERFRSLPDEASERLLEECDAFDEIPTKSPVLAGIFSAAAPGAGQAYAGRYGDAAMAFLVNSILIGGTVLAAVEEEDVTAGALGFVAFGFYSGNIYGGVNAAEKFNRRERDSFLTRARGVVRSQRSRWALTPASGGGTLSIYFDF